MTGPDDVRAGQIEQGLEAVRSRIASTCARLGRDPERVTLVVVTKTHPAQDVRVLARLGVTDVGENRDQEASAKATDCADLGLRWHFVGRLQSNKARSVARYADLVHSVDRVSLAAALGRAADGHGRREGRELGCLVQVSLDGDTSRGGAPVDRVAEVAAAIAAQPALRMRGLMAVAPLGVPAEEAFAPLAPMLDRLRAEHPGADVLSAGMSGDLEAALATGATHLRVGSAVLGARAPLR